MLLLTATKSNRLNSESGFTLIELLVVTLMIGIMAAIVGPGMLGFLARSKVTTAQGELQGILQEIQRSSIQKSRSCNISLPANDSKGTFEVTSVVTASTTSCLPIGDRALQDIQIRHNFDTAINAANTDNNLFDFRGNTNRFLDSNLVIILSNEDSNNFQKCIVVSSALGLIRAGNYPVNDVSTDPAKCSPTGTS
jgi:prepilin-type N-terminal cleavage/methylation domain-containing protein